MALRLIEINLPKAKLQAVEEAISGRKEVLDLIMQPAASSWKIPIVGNGRPAFPPISFSSGCWSWLRTARACSICRKKILRGGRLPDKHLRSGGIFSGIPEAPATGQSLHPTR